MNVTSIFVYSPAGMNQVAIVTITIIENIITNVWGTLTFSMVHSHFDVDKMDSPIPIGNPSKYHIVNNINQAMPMNMA